MLDVLDRAGSDDDIGIAFQDGLDESRDVVCAILVVGIRIDDDVSAVLESSLDACSEGARKSLVRSVRNDDVRAVLARDLGGAIGRPVVDDQNLDGTDAGNFSWKSVDGDAEGSCLVEAGDLDYEFR